MQQNNRMRDEEEKRKTASVETFTGSDYRSYSREGTLSNQLCVSVSVNVRPAL